MDESLPLLELESVLRRLDVDDRVLDEVVEVVVVDEAAPLEALDDAVVDMDVNESILDSS